VQAIHGSGTYDYFLYLIFLPVLIWLAFRYQSSSMLAWMREQTVFLNVVVGIYAFLLPLLFARFLFQYARWLFPPAEYQKTKRIGPSVHRAVAGAIFSTVVLGTAYDIAKGALKSLIGF
jgi:hypothetical protein